MKRGYISLQLKDLVSGWEETVLWNNSVVDIEEAWDDALDSKMGSMNMGTNVRFKAKGH